MSAFPWSRWTPSTLLAICLAVLVAGALVGVGLPAPAPVDWLRGIEAAVLVITGVIVFWYTVETARLRVVSEEQLDQAAAQVRAGVRPVLQLDAEGDRLRILNIGLGPALEVMVRAPALTGGDAQSERRDVGLCIRARPGGARQH